MKVVISRTYGKSETKGLLLVVENCKILTRCVTIELPDNGNQQNHSCILEGKYWMVKTHTEKHGDCFLLLDVPGRTGIEMHVGNFVNGKKIDSEGCICPGYYFEDINSDGFIDVAESTNTMKALLELLPDKVELHII